ncbi:aminotransferase class IV [Paenibacillus sp. SGZ-1009]|uniref:aminotransferase class IV n=1 Tax=Paenibacillus campi TaxID=3106031 RepID=UPI002AFFDD86|nr:aminotransferase class IV [Paenibacillus sp. SGZ-1009]
MNYVSINGVITPSEQAVVSVMDHGFLYGMGLFETMRTYNGRPFLLERHLRRLQASCDSLGIHWSITTEQAERQLQELMHANGLQEAYLRYTVSAGEDILGLPSGAYAKPNTIIYAKALPSASIRPAENTATAGRVQQSQMNTAIEGFNADHGTDRLTDDSERTPIKSVPIPTVQRPTKSLRRLHTVRNTPEGDIRLKSLHYMNSILGKRELALYADAPATAVEGLMLTAEGHLAEGIVSNVFFVQANGLYTPSVDTGILPGITRAFVMELAQRIGLPLEKGLYTWEQLIDADEIFVTNSVQEIVPIVRLLEDEREHQIGNGAIGMYTAMLCTAYEREAYRT